MLATRRYRALIAATVVATACEHAEPPARADTTVPPVPAAVEPSPLRTAESTWDASAGGLLVVKDDSLVRAVFPHVDRLTDTTTFDSLAVRGVSVQTFDRGGAVGAARLLGTRAGQAECTDWPSVRLEQTGLSRSSRWLAAFVRGVASPVPLDSLEGLSGADSAALAAEITRLAAGLPNDTAGAFQGIPFAVRTAYEFVPVPGVRAVVAEIVRRVNVEANPLQEHTLLVAERAATAREYRAVYSDRTSGSEEEVEQTDVLAAVMLGSARRPSLLLERAGYEWVWYALLERADAGTWRLRWESAYAGC